MVCGAAAGWSRGDYGDGVRAAGRRRNERLKEIKTKFLPIKYITI